jgi:hypothetical protein
MAALGQGRADAAPSIPRRFAKAMVIKPKELL